MTIQHQNYNYDEFILSLHNTMQSAKYQIIPYLFFDKIEKCFHIKDTPVIILGIQFQFVFIIWLIAWIINRIGGLPINVSDALILAIPAIFAGICMLIIKVIEDRAFVTYIPDLLMFPVEERGYQALESWFKQVFRIAPQVKFLIILGMASIFSAKVLLRNYKHLDNNYGLYFGIFVAFSLVGVGTYLGLKMPTVAKALSEHPLRLYPFNPAQSKIVEIGKTALGFLTLGIALIASIIMILVIVLNPWGEKYALINAIIWLLFIWSLTSYAFIYPNYYISKGIKSEKEKQIVSLDMIIMEYRLRMDSISVEEFKSLQNYMNLRESVWKSPNSTFNIGNFINYFVSLSLPLISTILTISNTLAH